MALTPRCRGGGGENLSEELANEDEGTNGNNFEPLSDSCGESDMEGLDLSLFEPSVDAASWCDSRIHAGTLHILVHYCGKSCLHEIYISLFLGDAMFVELPRVRLDGGARAFRQHWGYETRPLAPPPPLIEEDEAAVEPETVSLREANTASPIVDIVQKESSTLFPPFLSINFYAHNIS
ncbi:hypothetical protein P5V15_004680 [Pogonomyrmex californicus]